jgi:hypothetical protein
MRAILVAVVLVCASNALAQAEPLNPSLAPVGFLVGRWTNGIGKVADTGGSARGSSVITAEAGGAVLLRRDHTDLLDASGKPAGSFDQIMMIYPEGKTIHADYSDGQHVIHYTSAVVAPGRSVVFTSAAVVGAPVFKLSYALMSADELAVSFATAAPGQTEFHAIATGAFHRAN